MTLQDLIVIAEGHSPEKVEIKIADYHDGATAIIMDYYEESACQDKPESSLRVIQIKTMYGL